MEVFETPPALWLASAATSAEIDSLVNWTDYLLAVSVLLILLGALGLFAYAVQRGWILQGVTGLKPFLGQDERRLRLKETLVIDPRRRMVIVQADDEEHVLLLGSESETVLASKPARPDPEPEAMPVAASKDLDA